MNIPESDLAYERAGENDAACDELLATLQKKRSDCLKGLAWILGAIMVLGGLAFLLLLYPVFAPDSPHPALDWVFAHFNTLIIGVGLGFLFLTTGYMLPAVDYDRRIKILLYLRARQDRPS